MRRTLSFQLFTNTKYNQHVGQDFERAATKHMRRFISECRRAHMPKHGIINCHSTHKSRARRRNKYFPLTRNVRSFSATHTRSDFYYVFEPPILDGLSMQAFDAFVLIDVARRHRLRASAIETAGICTNREKKIHSIANGYAACIASSFLFERHAGRTRQKKK